MAVLSSAFLTRLWNGVLSYAVKFGVVGLVGMAIDVVIFNALLLGLLGEGFWWQTAVGAKFVSTSIAIVFNWLGNRFWTFRHRKRSKVLAEFAEYVVASLLGMGVTLVTLWVSHNLLGLTSLLADNVSANIIGLGLGTIVRFALYRFWIWGDHRDLIVDSSKHSQKKSTEKVA